MSSAAAAALAAIRHGVLPNGLTWSCWSEPRDRMVTVQVWLRVGSSDERAGQTGAAHMLEHLMFRGTQEVPDGEFDARMERRGALINAATWLDSTFYTTTCPPQVLREVLALEADRLSQLSITEEVFRTERDVVASERRQVVDEVPDARFRESFQATALAGSPYAWPVIGWAEDIASYQREAIDAFYRSHYVPARAHIVVCGPVEAGEVRDAIESTFASWSGGMHDAPAPGGVAGRPRRLDAKLPLAAPRVLMGFDAPARQADEFAAWRVTESVLAGGDAGRLIVRLDFDKQLVLNLDLDLPETRLPGLMTLEMTLREEVAPDDVVTEVDEALSALASSGPDPGELERAVRVHIADDARALASPESRAEWMGESWVVCNDPRALFSSSDALERVTPEAVRAVAAELLDPSRRTLGVAECL